MMKYDIIVTGCSYSAKAGVDKSYPDIINELPNYSVTNIAWPGQSNDSIIRNVKEEIRKGVTNTLFICQLTHLHRISKFCNVNKKWLDFQPAFVNSNPTIKDNNIKFDIHIFDKKNKNSKSIIGGIVIYGGRKKSDISLSQEAYERILHWYQEYLVFMYDEEHEFYELHHKIDELSKQVKDSGNDILYLYWPDDNFDNSLFEKNNFLKIDNDYSMLKWSVINSYTKIQDSHLSLIGHYKLAEQIQLYLENKSSIKIPFL